MASRPIVRWLAPAAVALAIIGGGAMTAALRASADASLTPRTAAQLLVGLQTAELDTVSGTVVERADFGLPALPDRIGGDGSAQFDSLIAGSHTMRVWYSGAGKARIALLGALGESDVIRNGKDLWIWSSRDNTATHATVPVTPAGSGLPRTPIGGLPGALTSHLPTSPQQVADAILAALDPTTSITSGGTTTVAGRSAYQLVLAPKDSASLVADVRIAIDAARHVPLRIEVYAKGYPKAAFEIGFTQVSFARPDDAIFRFNPPPGATVKQSGSDRTDGNQPDGGRSDGNQPSGNQPGASANGRPDAAVIGHGWTAVLAARLPQNTNGTAGSPDNGPGGQRDNTIDALVKRLPQINGPWGTGRILLSRLFSVLITDDGRIFIGAVDGSRLVAAATDPAGALNDTQHK